MRDTHTYYNISSVSIIFDREILPRSKRITKNYCQLFHPQILAFIPLLFTLLFRLVFVLLFDDIFTFKIPNYEGIAIENAIRNGPRYSPRLRSLRCQHLSQQFSFTFFSKISNQPLSTDSFVETLASPIITIIAIFTISSDKIFLQSRRIVARGSLPILK